MFEHRCEIHCRLPRGQRAGDGKVYRVNPPWEGLAKHFTKAFEAMALLLLRQMPVAAVARHVGECHRRAFEKLGGVPREVMVDNCKTAVLSHVPGTDPVFNAQCLDFARHYGFSIKAWGPGHPQSRSVVEKSLPGLPTKKPEEPLSGGGQHLRVTASLRALL